MRILDSNKKSFFILRLGVLLAVWSGLAASAMCAQTGGSTGGDEEAAPFVYQVEQRRNPFVPLLDKSGNKKEAGSSHGEELKVLLAKIVVNGVLWDENQPLVMVNNKIYKQGDEINGELKIKSITADGVVFEYFELTHTVSLIDKQKLE
ncbi:MAG: general secretion pathway protein GspB [Candidatus Omnitrophica bacterium]|nr:general secretion pathway protein GspB [Candidatus Omnitrophota bacterium]